MNVLNEASRHLKLFATLCIVIPFCMGAALVESGTIKARSKMLIRIYPENADNTKGALIYSGWLQKDETRGISTDRGRIIFDYRYSENDGWTTDIHAWCRQGNVVTVP
ncbi:hypothetical protein ACS5NO_13775 [Larkinella sp. GY13]|uniref:hypothetical protein n=1 Tax=Larkinella sp. GY13 TaxID=3453720 RepID=UPI003EEC675B